MSIHTFPWQSTRSSRSSASHSVRRGYALAFAASVVLASGMPAATDTWIGNNSANWADPLNWSLGAIPTSGSTVVFGTPGFSGNAITGPTSVVTLGGLNADGLVFSASAAAPATAGNYGYAITGTSAITLASSGTGVGVKVLSLNPQQLSAPITLSGDQIFQVGGATGNRGSILNLASGAVITSGSNRVIKEGTGTLNLNSGGNSAGGFTINNGAVQFGIDARFATLATTKASYFILNGGVLRWASNATVNLDSKRGITLGANGGTFSVANTANNPAFGNALTYNGVITGSSAFTKSGNGWLSIGGQNTYTGATQVNQGALLLNFAATGAPASNIINSSSNLVLGSMVGQNDSGIGSSLIPSNFGANPTLFIQAGTSGGSQTFNGTTISAGANNVIGRGNGTNSATLDLGAIGRTAGGTVSFSTLNDGGTGSAAFKTSTANTNGILGGWATTSAAATGTGAVTATDWAANDGSGNIVAYTGYTDIAQAGVIASSASSNVRIVASTTGSATLGAAVTDVNTIQSKNSAAQTITIGNTSTLRLGAAGGIWNQGAGSLTVGAGGTTGVLTAGGADNTAGELIITGTGGTTTVNSRITNNGTGVVTLTKAGTSNLSLTGTNTYTGGTYVSGGTVTATNASAFGTGDVYFLPTARLTLGGGGALVFANNFYFQSGDLFASHDLGGKTISGTVTLAAPNVTFAGASGGIITGKVTGDYSLGVGNGTLRLTNTSNDFAGGLIIGANGNANSPTVQLGASEVISNGAGKGNVTLSGGGTTGVATLDLNGFNETINGLANGSVTARTVVTNTSGTLSTLTLGDYDQSALYAGVVTSNLAITKIGEGVQTFSGANTYSGATTINNGILQAGVATVDGVSGAFGLGSAVTLANTAGATLALNGFNNTIGSLAGGGVSGGNVTLGSATLTTGNSSNTQYAGVISGTGGFVKVGSGTQILSGVNTYTGTTTVSAGSLIIGVGGSGSIASGNVTVQSGATLGGSGTINGATTIQSGGTLSPGNSPGVLTQSAGLTLNTGSSFTFELAANTTAGRGTNFDGVDITGGTLTIESGVAFNVVFNSLGSTVDFTSAFWTANQNWLVFSNANLPSTVAGIFNLGTVSNDSLGQTFSSTGGSLAFSQVGNDIYLNYTAVPEPGTWALLGLAGVAWLIVHRRRRMAA